MDELITLTGNFLLCKLLNSIRDANWFALMADETRDISNDEQLTIVIRWIDSSYQIHEDFIGLVHVPATTSNVLTAAIKDVLVRCMLPLSLCRGVWSC